MVQRDPSKPSNYENSLIVLKIIYEDKALAESYLENWTDEMEEHRLSVAKMRFRDSTGGSTTNPKNEEVQQ